MNRSFEFHDSRIANIAIIDRAAVISFDALYIHESAGQPGDDPGHGYYLKASFKISDATIEGLPAEFARISNGWIQFGATVYDNVVPLLPETIDETELNMTLTSGAIIKIKGRSCSIFLSSEPPSFIERVP